MKQEDLVLFLAEIRVDRKLFGNNYDQGLALRYIGNRYRDFLEKFFTQTTHIISCQMCKSIIREFKELEIMVTLAGFSKLLNKQSLRKAKRTPLKILFKDIIAHSLVWDEDEKVFCEKCREDVGTKHSFCPASPNVMFELRSACETGKEIFLQETFKFKGVSKYYLRSTAHYLLDKEKNPHWWTSCLTQDGWKKIQDFNILPANDNKETVTIVLLKNQGMSLCYFGERYNIIESGEGKSFVSPFDSLSSSFSGLLFLLHLHRSR